MLAVIEVGLVERAALPLVDRAGIAVAELVEFAAVVSRAGDEGNEPLRRAGLGVKRDRDAVALDRADGADSAIDDPGPSLLAARARCR